jgi:hypothetical protein
VHVQFTPNHCRALTAQNLHVQRGFDRSEDQSDWPSAPVRLGIEGVGGNKKPTRSEACNGHDDLNDPYLHGIGNGMMPPQQLARFVSGEQPIELPEAFHLAPVELVVLMQAEDPV